MPLVTRSLAHPTHKLLSLHRVQLPILQVTKDRDGEVGERKRERERERERVEVGREEERERGWGREREGGEEEEGREINKHKRKNG